jgi:Na+-translocating ferredoxin:NAD+ oxidoreductase subunit B
MKKKQPNANAIDALLPQTQCGLCDYDACLPYAQAISDGDADIDHCHPGGTKTLEKLAHITGKSTAPYLETVKKQYRPPAIVTIREDECIGCTKCIQACPVDAIIGAAKQMHTIVAKDCNGCELCIEPCPVDCIDIIALPPRTEPQEHFEQQRNRVRYGARENRLARIKEERAQKHQSAKIKKTSHTATVKSRQDAIAAALARVKKK